MNVQPSITLEVHSKEGVQLQDPGDPIHTAPCLLLRRYIPTRHPLLSIPLENLLGFLSNLNSSAWHRGDLQSTSNVSLAC